MRNSEKEFFDEMALKYQSYAILVPGASRFRNMLLDKAMRKALTPILKSFNKMLILDIGCGVGRWARVLPSENSIIGVDISRSMIRMAKVSCKNRNCCFVVADISFLPFKENVFELVVSITVLQHILGAEKFFGALSEIARCGKSEALIVEEMSSDREIVLEKVYCPIRILPVESYVKDLSSAGLQAYCIRGLTPAPLAIFLTRLLGSTSRIFGGTFNVKVRDSKMISRLVHFSMGIGVLSACFAPRGYYNPRLSLHTVICAKKKIARINFVL